MPVLARKLTSSRTRRILRSDCPAIERVASRWSSISFVTIFCKVDQTRLSTWDIELTLKSVMRAGVQLRVRSNVYPPRPGRPASPGGLGIFISSISSPNSESDLNSLSEPEDVSPEGLSSSPPDESSVLECWPEVSRRRVGAEGARTRGGVARRTRRVTFDMSTS